MKRTALNREKFSVIFIMVIYLASVFPFYTFHHHEKPCNHKKQNRSEILDACHLTLYHSGSKVRCTHPSHITKVINSCRICKDYSPGFGIGVASMIFYGKKGSFTEVEFFAGSEYCSSLQLLTNKSPPSIFRIL
ncbi:MAG: hypothetical protein K1X92_11505 [Bacteroidia bacterium]|nr:hypothetical protein [Bacteroidia bacterium]